MATDIEVFCISCAKCQMNKASTFQPQGLLHGLPIPERPWQSIGIDLMGPLPQSHNYNHLMVFIDWLSSEVHLAPTTTQVTAKEIAWLFLKNIVWLHGVPDSIVSDRDPKFTSIFWRELQHLMGIKLLMSMAFHPQTDGATERENRSIGQILQTIIQDDQRNWADKCPMVELTLNSNISATTGLTPLEITCGHMPRIGLPLVSDTKFKGVKWFVQQTQWNLMAAHDTIIERHIMQTFHCKAARIWPCWKSKGDFESISSVTCDLEDETRMIAISS